MVLSKVVRDRVEVKVVKKKSEIVNSVSLGIQSLEIQSLGIQSLEIQSHFCLCLCLWVLGFGASG